MNNCLNNCNERLKVGLNLASNSFSLLWQHPILLAYLSINIAFYLILQTISYNTGRYDLSFTTGLINAGQLFELSHWHHYIWLLIFTFSYIYISTFITVCLILHVNNFLRHRQVKLVKNILYARKKFRIILYWSLITTFLSYLMQVLSSYTSTPGQIFTPYMFFISLLGIAWSLITLIVVPIIALEKTTIIMALKRSKDVVFSLFIEIIAGEFWIALIAFLASMPFIIPLLVKMNTKLPSFLILVATCCIMLITLLTSTVQAIFKTIVYTYYIKPLEELEQLRYPRF